MNNKEINFEQLLADLEAKVNELENGNLDLETMMAKYNEGMALVKQGNDILDKTEQALLEKVD